MAATPPPPERPERSDKIRAFREKLPPGDEEAEQGLLGCVLEKAREILPSVRRIVQPDDFSRNKYRIIYQTILDMADRGDPVDIATVPIELRRLGKLEDPEDWIDVTSLPNLIANIYDAEYFAKTIHDASIARHAIDWARQVSALGYDNVGAAKIVAEIDRLHGELHERAGALTVNRFGIMSDLELEQMRPVRGILGTWIRDQDIVAIYGKTDSYKTFVAIGMGMCWATGLDWYGMPVEQRTVLYIATEAPQTIGERKKAWKLQHGMAGQQTEFYTSTLPVDLTSREEVSALIGDIRAMLPDAPGAIIVDTYATATSGDEKDASTVNAAYRGMRMLRDAFGATIIYVDHEGKDRERGQTGSQRKQDNVDVQIHVERVADCNDMITVKAQKIKTAESPTLLTLQTKKMSWFDPREETMADSLVLVSTSKEQAHSATAEARSQRLPRRQRQALDILSDLPSQKGSYGDWWRACHAADESFKKSSFDDARKKLVESRLISVTDNIYASLVQSQNRTSTTVPNRTGTVSTVGIYTHRTTVPTIRSSVETVPSGADGADVEDESREYREYDEAVTRAPYHTHDPVSLVKRRDGSVVCDGCHPRPNNLPPKGA